MNKLIQIKPGLRFLQKSILFQENNILIFIKNDTNISLNYVFSGLECGYSPVESSFSYEIEFIFDLSYLAVFDGLNQEMIIKGLPEYQKIDICCNTQLLLHEIVKCNLDSGFKHMFIESKALALFVMFKQYTITKTNHCESCKFLTKPIEKDKIIKAKDILMSRLHQPPTIQAISLEVGINQCYLKKGFKELYGYTIYEFLIHERMVYAKLLLQTRDLSISEVAQQIGYANTSSFSSAFKKNTGFFPSELKP